MNKCWTVLNNNDKEIKVSIPEQLGIKQENCVSKWLSTIELDIWTVPEAFALYLIKNDNVKDFVNIALCLYSETDEIKWTGDDLNINIDYVSIEMLNEMVANFFCGLSQSAKKSIMTYQYVTNQKMVTKALDQMAIEQTTMSSPKKLK